MVDLWRFFFVGKQLDRPNYAGKEQRRICVGVFRAVFTILLEFEPENPDGLTFNH